jgi:thiamine biosynthesis lipoprotein
MRLDLDMVLPFLLIALVAAPSPTPQVDRRVLAMGTELRLHLEGPGPLAEEAERALTEVARIEGACSTWNPASSWSRFNGAQGRAVPMDAEWLGLLARVQAWSERTQGAFDPLLAPLVQAWGLRGQSVTPASATLAAAREASGIRHLVLDAAAGTARLRHPAAGLEEGGFLKGYALDRLHQMAQTREGLLDFGGQLLAWGRPVTVSVADPQHRQLPRLSFRLNQASLSCSGTSERGRHILDPRTGVPCPAWGSTAVVAADGLTADVLSTALFVLGPDAGLRWAEREGIAAVFLLNDGSLRMSRAFRALQPTLHPRESR